MWAINRSLLLFEPCSSSSVRVPPSRISSAMTSCLRMGSSMILSKLTMFGCFSSCMMLTSARRTSACSIFRPGLSRKTTFSATRLPVSFDIAATTCRAQVLSGLPALCTCARIHSHCAADAAALYSQCAADAAAHAAGKDAHQETLNMHCIFVRWLCVCCAVQCSAADC